MPPEPPMELRAVAAELGVHYQTVYRWVRSGRLPAVMVSGKYLVDRADLADFARLRASPKPVPAPGSRRLNGQAERMYDALCAGDDPTARRIARRLVEEGTSVKELIVQVLAPPLSRIGQSWKEGETSIWVEHRASAIVDRILGELTPTPRGRRRGTVVVAAVAGDLHVLPTAMAAAVLREDNWHVEHLGANMPPDELVGFCTAHDVSVVVLSVTNSEVSDVAQRAAATIREAAIPVLVGGVGRSLDGLIDDVRVAASLARRPR